MNYFFNTQIHKNFYNSVNSGIFNPNNFTTPGGITTLLTDVIELTYSYL